MAWMTSKKSLPWALILSIIFFGCTTIPEKRGLIEEVAEDPRLTTTQLRLLLNEFVGNFTNMVEEAADKIILQSSSTKVQRNALLWKINAIPACFRAASIRDPLAALVDTYILSKQMRRFFEDGSGRDAFGPFQSIAIDYSRNIEDEMSRIARIAGAREKSIRRVEDWTDYFTSQAPITSLSFSRRSGVPDYIQFVETQEQSIFEVVGDISDTVSLLQDLTVTYADHLPNQARWQVHLLILDMKVPEAASDVRKMLSNVTQSTGKLAEITERISARVEEELAVLTEGLRQERIQSFQEIDEMRVATLGHITNERIALLETVEKEREELMAQSARLADHVLMRAFQLGLALVFIIFILTSIIIFFFRAKKI